MEKMKMALLYGADAVYLAGKVFGLRAYGGNFSMEELKEAVSYAHSMGKKVYVTVNIIPRNEDLEGLDDYLKYLESIHVDAALISDLGVFSLCREVAPNLPIHVSTRGKLRQLAHREGMEGPGRRKGGTGSGSVGEGNGGNPQKSGH